MINWRWEEREKERVSPPCCTLHSCRRVYLPDELLTIQSLWGEWDMVVSVSHPHCMLDLLCWGSFDRSSRCHSGNRNWISLKNLIWSPAEWHAEGTARGRKPHAAVLLLHQTMSYYHTFTFNAFICAPCMGFLFHVTLALLHKCKGIQTDPYKVTQNTIGALIHSKRAVILVFV